MVATQASSSARLSRAGTRTTVRSPSRYAETVRCRRALRTTWTRLSRGCGGVTSTTLEATSDESLQATTRTGTTILRPQAGDNVCPGEPGRAASCPRTVHRHRRRGSTPTPRGTPTAYTSLSTGQTVEPLTTRSDARSVFDIGAPGRSGAVRKGKASGPHRGRGLCIGRTRLPAMIARHGATGPTSLERGRSVPGEVRSAPFAGRPQPLLQIRRGQRDGLGEGLPLQRRLNRGRAARGQRDLGQPHRLRSLGRDRSRDTEDFGHQG